MEEACDCLPIKYKSSMPDHHMTAIQRGKEITGGASACLTTSRMQEEATCPTPNECKPAGERDNWRINRYQKNARRGNMPDSMTGTLARETDKWWKKRMLDTSRMQRKATCQIPNDCNPAREGDNWWSGRVLSDKCNYLPSLESMTAKTTSQ